MIQDQVNQLDQIIADIRSGIATAIERVNAAKLALQGKADEHGIDLSSEIASLENIATSISNIAPAEAPAAPVVEAPVAEVPAPVETPAVDEPVVESAPTDAIESAPVVVAPDGSEAN